MLNFCTTFIENVFLPHPPRRSKRIFIAIFSGVILSIKEESHGAFAYIQIDIGGGYLWSRITRKSLSNLALAIGMPVFALVKSAALSRGAMH